LNGVFAVLWPAATRRRKGNVMAKRKKAERNRDLCPGTEDPADRLFAEVAGILEQSRRQTVRSVNTYMVTAY
jgi:hypothetical protein